MCVMQEPTVSVVMPVYNGQRYLSRAVESMLGQTWWDFELVAVNDGSTDETGRILERYAKGDGRVRVVWQENQGIVGALNAGLGAARGKLLARMDADDVALPGRLARQVDYLREHPECVAVGTRVLMIDAQGWAICPWVKEFTHEQIDAAHLRAGFPMVHPSVMMRRESVAAVGGYRAEYATLEDVDLFLRLAEVGRLANIPEVLLHYRQHLNSICHQRAEKISEVRRRLYQETYARRGLKVEEGLSYCGKAVSRRQRYAIWAWWALGAGYVATARRHALAYFGRAFWSPGSWRLMYCALRGR